MRWHGIAVGLVAACALVGVQVAGAESNASDLPGTCPAPFVHLSEIARYEIAPAGPTTRSATAPAAANAFRADGAEQTIGVTVPVGPLTVLGAPATVVLTRAAGQTGFRGVVRGITVVDARGADSGWTLTARLTGAAALAGAPVEMCVEAVEATARSTAGLGADTSARAAPARADESLTLLRAAPGTGDGAFALTISVAADPVRSRAEHIAAHINFDITPTARRVTATATG